MFAPVVYKIIVADRRNDFQIFLNFKIEGLSFNSNVGM